MQNRIDELRSLLRAEPESRRFFQLGDLLRKIGRFDEAEEVFRQGLEHHPRYTAAWVSLGRVQLEQGKFHDAESSFTRSLELDPENSVSARLLGDTALAAGEHVRAIKAYKLARALGDPELDEKIEEVETLIRASQSHTATDAFPVHEGVDREEAPLKPDENSVLMHVPAVEEELSPFETGPDEVTGISERRPRSQQIVFVGDDDPFGLQDFEAPNTAFGDVFSSDSEPREDGVEADLSADVFGGVEAVEPPSQEEVETRGVESLREAEEEVEKTTVGPESEEDDRIPEIEESSDAENVPLPTLTLARLAWKQGEVALAESTLRLVLLKDPENAGAHELLEEIANSSSRASEKENAEPVVLEEVSESEIGEAEEFEIADMKPLLSADELRRKKILVLDSWVSGIRRVSGDLS